LEIARGHDAAQGCRVRVVVVIELIWTVLVVLLVISKVWAALDVPIIPPVKLRLVGALLTGASPVPVRPTQASRLLLLL